VISAFERTVAFRYLRAQRREGFISVTAGFSLAGIALGVAALIIVMSGERGTHGLTPSRGARHLIQACPSKCFLRGLRSHLGVGSYLPT